MSIGPLEFAVILIVVLLLFGPSKLPGLGKAVGEAIRGFKKGVSGVEEQTKEQIAQKQKDEETKKS